MKTPEEKKEYYRIKKQESRARIEALPPKLQQAKKRSNLAKNHNELVKNRELKLKELGFRTKTFKALDNSFFEFWEELKNIYPEKKDTDLLILILNNYLSVEKKDI